MTDSAKPKTRENTYSIASNPWVSQKMLLTTDTPDVFAVLSYEHTERPAGSGRCAADQPPSPIFAHRLFSKRMSSIVAPGSEYLRQRHRDTVGNRDQHREKVQIWYHISTQAMPEFASRLWCQLMFRIAQLLDRAEPLSTAAPEVQCWPWLVTGVS